jgi:adenine phosphoribosyltransferase
MPSERLEAEIAAAIRSVPGFPKPGIVFRDITTLLKDPRRFADAVDGLLSPFADIGVDKVASVEARGFIFGAALALRLNAGFIPIRKPGKLPAEVLRREYALEYGSDAVEIHRDAISKGDRILVHDDLLATGGTIEAACGLIEDLGGTIVGVSFLVELTFLGGRQRLGRYPVHSLVRYNSE